MEIIDYDSWGRRAQSDLFKDIGIPFYSVTTELDVAPLYKRCKAEGLSFYHAMIYVSSKAINAVPAFLDKLREGFVVRYDRLTPSFTYMRTEELFGICNVEWIDGESMESFCARCKEAEAQAKQGEAVPSETDEARDDMIYLSCTPWFSFTHVTQEMSLDPCESIPRVLWGKFFEREGKLILPMTIQVNHRLIDGVHIARWLSKMETMIGSMRTDA